MNARTMTARTMTARTMTARQGTAGSLALLTLAAGALTAAQVQTPVRLYLTVAFVLLGPGWALASGLRITQPALLWTLAAGLGIALAILVAQVMVSAGYWHPWGAMLGFEALTLALLLRRLVRR